MGVFLLARALFGKPLLKRFFSFISITLSSDRLPGLRSVPVLVSYNLISAIHSILLWIHSNMLFK